MVNVLLLSEARGRGFGIYRNVLRRCGVGLSGGRVLTKGQLRGILQEEDRMRVLVGQLSTIGREVRSTTMQWAYEGKKLESTVKHLSLVPPWVRVADSERENKFREPFVGTDVDNATVIDDEVGLGRHPSLWWTTSCMYNAAYDVQRLTPQSTQSVTDVGGSTAGARQERFEFARDNPDLVAYMLTLRTELLMRIVMPAVVGHSVRDPYMDMARFEVGPNGNPHWHGLSVGKRSPQFRPVKDDVAGGGDPPPQTASEDVRACQRLWEKEDPDAWSEEMEKYSLELDELVRRALTG